MFYYRKIALLTFVFCSLSSLSFAQNKGDEARKMYNDKSPRDQKAINEALDGWWSASMKLHDERLEWWRDARFGMFIHWGVSAVPGGEWKGQTIHGYAEHLMRIMRISKAEYTELAKQFKPTDFVAETWVKSAKAAGMRYFIVTAKHHDGLAMYNSEYSDFDLSMTPFKRDPMAELAAACRKYGLKFGFYYSHAFDWEHPDAPGNDWEFNNPGGDKNLFGGRNWFEHHPELIPKAVKYVNEKSIPQIKELIRRYNPDILWFDTPHKLPFSENLRILEEIRKVAPDIVVNGRLASIGSMNFGDYQNTADRPAEFYPVTGDWEAIPTTNESYGYNQHDHSHKSPTFFVQLLAKAASRGGNLLLNIGPMGNGAFDPVDEAILKRIGKWMDVNAESIYKTHKTTLPLQNWGVTTQRNDKLYLHIFDWPSDGNLVIGGLKNKIGKAYFLADKKQKPLATTRLNTLDLGLTLPGKAIDSLNSVIVLEPIGEVEADETRLLEPNNTNRLLAFDATLHGGGFGFGDGKPKRFYVDNWTEKSQWISWKLRLNKAAKYAVRLSITGSKTSGGSFKITIADKTLKVTLPENQQSGQIQRIDAGKLRLNAGQHELGIIPPEITGKELMKLLAIELRPVD